MDLNEVRETVEDNIGDWYFDEDKHKLTNDDISNIANVFYAGKLTRKLYSNIGVSYEYNCIDICYGNADHSGTYERCKKAVDKLNKAGFHAECAIELRMWFARVNNIFQCTNA